MPLPSDNYKERYGTEARIQLNDKLANINDIGAFVAAERATKREGRSTNVDYCFKSR